MEIAIPVPDVISRLQNRLFAQVSSAIEEWAKCVPEITRWEDEHLLENPAPERLQDHKATIERLLRFGRFLTLLVQQDDFPDPKLAQMVGATQTILRDKHRMWHGPRMSKEKSDRILSVCYSAIH